MSSRPHSLPDRKIRYGTGVTGESEGRTRMALG